MVRFFLEHERLVEFVEHLQRQRRVIAPHRRGERSFVFQEVEDPAAVVLDYPRTLQSIRKFFLPPREELLAFDLTDQSFEAPEPEPIDAVFLGVHSYDMAALARLDHSFSTGNPERNYLARRQGALFVGVTFEPDAWHFSGSVGIEPDDTDGCDVFLARLLDGYVLDVLTEAGRRLVEGFELPPYEGPRPPAHPFHQHIYVPQSRLSGIMGHSFEHPVWAEAAQGCVGCGTCNLVCPTCYCFDVAENVDITATKGYRERSWDGCTLRRFSEVAGGEVFREHLAARQRHRVLRKFKYISDATGMPWCVGCGRCTSACPAGISIAAIVNRIVGDAERVPVAPI
ncbi:MAG TPA: 4Fe-4S dicluster domain-containing protein [Candidatus Krumholzibacteria bacterium]|nr:4Fe-4S dicluster domain-containing protein [Candidatus Krumholzibacteria bacterium]